MLKKESKITIVTGDALLVFVFKMLLPTVKIKCMKHTRKHIKARSTKHQVHLGINYSTSVLINTFVILCLQFLKDELEFIDNMYSKMQSLLHSTVGCSAVCDCDISWPYSLFSKHNFIASMIKYF